MAHEETPDHKHLNVTCSAELIPHNAPNFNLLGFRVQSTKDNIYPLSMLDLMNPQCRMFLNVRWMIGTLFLPGGGIESINILI